MISPAANSASSTASAMTSKELSATFSRPSSHSRMLCRMLSTRDKAGWRPPNPISCVQPGSDRPSRMVVRSAQSAPLSRPGRLAAATGSAPSACVARMSSSANSRASASAGTCASHISPHFEHSSASAASINASLVADPSTNSLARAVSMRASSSLTQFVKVRMAALTEAGAPATSTRNVSSSPPAALSSDRVCRPEAPIPRTSRNSRTSRRSGGAL
mmetsp:Transcript_38658/g.90387  ORF Transcript_38658/g.90387 Transcript_38658/m.90387 type:complete len:217 (+) Transcript_38658:561-1211(+)